jgi:hypothetical protein
MNLLLALILFDSIAFFAYGLSCLFSQKMKTEFIRFGLASAQRKITGIAQVLGGLGLIIGYFLDVRISIFSTLGLCVLMLAGFIVRVKIKDTLAETLPSFLFMLLNLILTYFLIGNL